MCRTHIETNMFLLICYRSLILSDNFNSTFLSNVILVHWQSLPFQRCLIQSQFVQGEVTNQAQYLCFFGGYITFIKLFPTSCQYLCCLAQTCPCVNVIVYIFFFSTQQFIATGSCQLYFYLCLLQSLVNQYVLQFQQSFSFATGSCSTGSRIVHSIFSFLNLRTYQLF